MAGCAAIDGLQRRVSPPPHPPGSVDRLRDVAFGLRWVIGSGQSGPLRLPAHNARMGPTRCQFDLLRSVAAADAPRPNP